jgi:U3 small nucleolar RNA-associated protein 21
MEEDEVWEAEAEGPVALPDMRGEDEDGEDDGPTELGEDEEGDAIRRVYTSPPQMEGAQEGALVTLTTMPRTRWMTLLNLDTIKRRNKPTEAPKKPERAPFFLPQLAGTELAFDAQKPAQAGGKEEKTGLPSRPAFGQEGLDFESDFVRRLRSAQESGECELRRLRSSLTPLTPSFADGPFFQYLHTLSPPALDAELRSLSTAAELELFIGALTARLRRHLDYEAVQALLAVFVRVQADVLIALGIKVTAPPQGDASMERDGELADEGETLAEALRLLLVEQHREGTRVMELLEYCMGSLAFVRDLPLT